MKKGFISVRAVYTHQFCLTAVVNGPKNRTSFLTRMRKVETATFSARDTTEMNLLWVLIGLSGIYPWLWLAGSVTSGLPLVSWRSSALSSANIYFYPLESNSKSWLEPLVNTVHNQMTRKKNCLRCHSHWMIKCWSISQQPFLTNKVKWSTIFYFWYHFLVIPN